MMSGLCLSFPSELMALRVLGALLNLTDTDQLLPALQETSFSSGLGTQSWPDYAVGMFLSDLAFWMHPSPVSSPTSCPCLLDWPWQCLVSLSAQRLWWDSLLWPLGSAPSSDPVALPLCQWGHGLCWVTCASCFQPLMAQPCSTAHADSLYACQKSPMRNSVKPFRALEGNKGVIINLCRITSLCYAKMSSPGNRDSCIELNWAVSSSCWKPGF